MSIPISDEHLGLLKTFIGLCSCNPSYIHDPSLKFFKDYLISVGANLPPEVSDQNEETEEKPSESEKMEEDKGNSEDSEESELELDESGVVEPDNDDPLPQGQEDIEVTENMLNESCAKREQAMNALHEDKKEEAIEFLTQSILANPQGAIGYAKRAGVLLGMNKPNAAIRDCDKALTLNPDQALAYKFRGRAHRLLGHWEAAAKDLALACKLDYTDEANEWLKEVTPNVKKLQEHNRKYERKHMEKRQREYRKARAASAEEKQSQQQETMDTDFSEDGSGAGPNLTDLLCDPDIAGLLSDPDIASAFTDINSPEGLSKLYSHPKVAEMMSKVKAKMGEKKTDDESKDI